VVALFPVLHVCRQLKRPPPADYPIVLVIVLFHMVAFAALMTAGLTYVSAGRTIVLGYTTPLRVAPAAMLFLKERMSTRQIVGIGIGMAGLLLLVGPGATDWHSGQALLGHGLPVLGIGMAALLLGEGLDQTLVVSAFIILAGLAIGSKTRD
jgi:drug/metabolite transporter (DMT)-like permease